MVTDAPPPEGPRRKRPARTIDLEATEVPDAGSPADAKDGPEEAAAPPPEPFIPPPPELPHHQAAPGDADAVAGDAARRSSIVLPMLGAGAAGAGVAVIALVALWSLDVMPTGRQTVVDPAPRLEAIETQLRDLAARPTPVAPTAPIAAPAVDPKLIEALTARLDKLEAAAAAPRQPVTDPAVVNRIGAVDASVKSLAEQLNGLARRNDDAATALGGRLDALAAAVAELDKKEREARSDNPVRLAVAADALRAAVERGTPFATELATAKALSPNSAALGLLDPFAATGLPNDASLGRELSALIQPMLKAAAPQPSETGILERLQANAEKLVRIRPVDAPAGDDPTALLARIEFKAARGDVAGVLADLPKLPSDARVKAQAWMSKVEARDRALAAIRRFNADAITALKTP